MALSGAARSGRVSFWNPVQMAWFFYAQKKVTRCCRGMVNIVIYIFNQSSSCSSFCSFLISTLPIRECVTLFFSSMQMPHRLNNSRVDIPEEYSASAIKEPPKTMSTTKPSGDTASPNKCELSIILPVIHIFDHYCPVKTLSTDSNVMFSI